MFPLPPGYVSIGRAILRFWEDRYPETAGQPGASESDIPPARKAYEDSKADAQVQYQSILGVFRDALVSGELIACVVDDNGTLWSVAAEYWSAAGRGQTALRTGAFDAPQGNLYGQRRLNLKPVALQEASLLRWAGSAKGRKAFVAAAHRVVGHVSDSPNKTRSSARLGSANRSLDNWYRDHVTTLHRMGERSSLEKDLVEARKQYRRQASRDRMRALRRKYAPAEWSRPGRPRKV